MSSYPEIDKARSGREMRFALSDAFNQLYEKGRNADHLTGTSGTFTADDFGKKTDVPSRLPSKYYKVDSKPTKNSENLVASGSIIDVVGDIDSLEF